MEVKDELLKRSAENADLRGRIDTLEKTIAVLIHEGNLIRPVCGGAESPGEEANVAYFVVVNSVTVDKLNKTITISKGQVHCQNGLIVGYTPFESSDTLHY
jgi:hypothetical protein